MSDSFQNYQEEIEEMRMQVYIDNILKIKLNNYITMGGCESAQSQQIESPKKMNKSSLFSSKKIEKHKFAIPNTLKNNLDVWTDNGKITDYITKNHFPIKNNYQTIDIRNFLGEDNKFQDPDFIAQNISLGKQPFANHVTWHRPDGFLEGPFQIFEGKIQPTDIRQGRLGNCYFLSALGAISEYPFIVKRIFQTTQQSTYGMYGIWLFIDGFWQCIVVDDYFPIYKKKPLYSRNNGNQLWVMLLEKAYAKVFQSYEAIETGLTGVAMNAITGAPYQYLCKDSSHSITPERAWEFITEHLSQNHLLNGSTQNNDRNGYFGLISTHCYAILDCKEVKVRNQGKKERVLKLSNPWGKYEWNGRWSQGSDVWTEGLKKKLNFEKKNDGLFWMNIDDFVSNFGQICVCKYNKNNINTSIPLEFSEKENGFKCIYMGVSNQTQGQLTVFQKDHHHFLKGEYEYSLVRVIVMQLNKSSRTLERYISDAFDCDKDTSMHLKLNPGEYYIFIEVDWKSEFSREVTLNFYGQNSVSLIQDENPLEVENLFNQIVLIHQNYTEKDRIFVYQSQPNIRRVTGSLAGYVYYYYVNRSKKDKYLCESVVLKQRNQIVVHGQERQGDFMVKVFPGEQKVVRLKVQKQGNSFYSFSTKIQFYIVDKYSLDKLRDIVERKSIKIKKRELQGKQINVVIKTYQYSGGIALLYQNKLEKHVYVEEINFEIDNLEFENGKFTKPGKLTLAVGPKTEKLLSFLVIRPDKQVSFKTQVSFILKAQETND